VLVPGCFGAPGASPYGRNRLWRGTPVRCRLRLGRPHLAKLLQQQTARSGSPLLTQASVKPQALLGGGVGTSWRTPALAGKVAAGLAPGWPRARSAAGGAARFSGVRQCQPGQAAYDAGGAVPGRSFRIGALRPTDSLDSR
jgi:hypothetical protein